jgi:hypothetical protein
MNTRTLIIALIPGLLLSACTWVKLTPEGESVEVMASADAACEKVGSTKSIGKSEVASIDRNEEKVAKELETLARNHAAGMGGNAIVPAGPVSAEGERTYTVYKCP